MHKRGVNLPPRFAITISRLFPQGPLPALILHYGRPSVCTVLVMPEMLTPLSGTSKILPRLNQSSPDYTVGSKFCEKLQFPPKRTRGNPIEKDGTELTLNERKWVGHVCGQLSWLARQCRGDLLFGVSRVQQLAGVGDPAALDELYVLVERAKDVKTMRFKPLGISWTMDGGGGLGCLLWGHAAWSQSGWSTS